MKFGQDQVTEEMEKKQKQEELSENPCRKFQDRRQN